MSDPKPLIIEYTNYRGETSVRRIMPFHIFWGSNEWHPEPQWLLDADDLDKGETRIFAMKDMRPLLQKL